MKIFLIIGIIICSFISGICINTSFMLFKEEKKEDNWFNTGLAFLAISIILSVILNLNTVIK